MKTFRDHDDKEKKSSHQQKMKTVAKGVKESSKEISREQKRKGSSNEGKYKHVAPKDFAGSAGGASPHSYPINTRKRAKAALSYARNAPNPSGIKKAVYKKYPGLKKGHED